MRILVIWHENGRSPLIQLNVFGWRLRISLRKRVVSSGSFQVGDPMPNKEGFLVRGDLPLATSSAPTAAAQRPASTSP